MSRGISLLELTVGMVVTAVAFIGFSRVTGIASRAQRNSVLKVQADQQMRLFLENQKKHIAQSRNPYPAAGSILSQTFQNRNCSFLVTGNPTINNCGNTNLTFSNLFVNRFGNASDPATYFAENIRVECAEPPRDIIIEPAMKAVMLDCTPCSTSQLPVIRISRSDRPGVVLRMSGAQESFATRSASEEGATVATSLCITHNGLISPADPNSFNLFNLRVRSLVRQNGSVVLRELSSAVPAPTAYPGGLRVLSSD